MCSLVGRKFWLCSNFDWFFSGLVVFGIINAIQWMQTNSYQARQAAIGKQREIAGPIHGYCICAVGFLLLYQLFYYKKGDIKHKIAGYCALGLWTIGLLAVWINKVVEFWLNKHESLNFQIVCAFCDFLILLYYCATAYKSMQLLLYAKYSGINQRYTFSKVEKINIINHHIFWATRFTHANFLNLILFPFWKRVSYELFDTIEYGSTVASILMSFFVMFDLFYHLHLEKQKRNYSINAKIGSTNKYNSNSKTSELAQYLNDPASLQSTNSDVNNNNNSNNNNNNDNDETIIMQQPKLVGMSTKSANWYQWWQQSMSVRIFDIIDEEDAYPYALEQETKNSKQMPQLATSVNNINQSIKIEDQIQDKIQLSKVEEQAKDRITTINMGVKTTSASATTETNCKVTERDETAIGMINVDFISYGDPNFRVYTFLLIGTFFAEIMVFVSLNIVEGLIPYYTFINVFISLVNSFVDNVLKTDLIIVFLYKYVLVNKFVNNKKYLKYLLHRWIINRHAIHYATRVMGLYWHVLHWGKFNGWSSQNIISKRKSMIGTIILSIIVFCYCMQMLLYNKKIRNKFHHSALDITQLCLIVLYCVYYVIFFDFIKSTSSTFIIGAIPCLLGLLIVLFIINGLPISIEKVKVECSVINDNMIKCTFNGDHGDIGRVALINNTTSCTNIFGPFREFSVTLNDVNNNNHSILISGCGQWSKKLIYSVKNGLDSCTPQTSQHKEEKEKEKEENKDEENKEKTVEIHLYVKKLRGISYIHFVKSYKSVLFVCSGAGISPVLPFYCLQNDNNNFGLGVLEKKYVLWIVDDPKINYPDILDLLEEKTQANSTNNRYLIYDTSRLGRPNLKKVIKNVFDRTSAEAVFCVTNKVVAQIITRQCDGHDIPIYGSKSHW